VIRTVLVFTALLISGIVSYADPLPDVPQVRVVGADLLTDGTDPEVVVPELIRTRLTANEFALFKADCPTILNWAQVNRERWASARNADRREKIARFGKLAIWKEVNITHREFLAVQVKLMFAQRFSLYGIDSQVKEVQDQIEILNHLLTKPGEMTVEERDEKRMSVAVYEDLIRAMRAYPKENLNVYLDHRQWIDQALKQFAALSE
jgi:hypothetical protein